MYQVRQKRKPFAFLLYLSSQRIFMCRLVGLLTTDYVQQHPISFSSHFILSQLMMIWDYPKSQVSTQLASIDNRSNSKLHMS